MSILQSSPQIRLAALLTCHNRRVETLECLKALYEQILPSFVKLSVYLVDDGSTDGTSESVRHLFPHVNLIAGDGQLFWNRGMRVAIEEAMKHDYDHYLWINDDTILYPNAIQSLIEMNHKLEAHYENNSILVGSVCDPETKIFTYGGVYKSNLFHPLKFKKVIPNGTIQSCDTMNGNCVLIPRHVIQKIGNLDPSFSHRFGDFDYGLRARESGFRIWATPAFLGECSRNSKLQTSELLQKIHQPKFRPFLEMKVFTKRHGGLLWFIFWLSPYVKLHMLSVFQKNRLFKIFASLFMP